MNNYIKPEIKVVPITLENSILTGSTSVGIGEGPATGPALSKATTSLTARRTTMTMTPRAAARHRCGMIKSIFFGRCATGAALPMIKNDVHIQSDRYSLEY